MPGDQIPSASDLGGAWGFNRKDAARIARAVRRIEAQLFNRAPQRGRYPIGATGASFPGIPGDTGSATVAAGSAGSPTKFTANIYGLSGSGPGLAPVGTSDAYNPYPASLPPGKFAWFVSFNGFIYIVTLAC
jgi:hypothetical protein